MTELKRACYVAGPMRGRADYHFPVFFEAEYLLERAGWNVFNPARVDVLREGWPSQEALDGTPLLHRTGLTVTVVAVNTDFRPEDVRKYAKRDCKILIEYLAAERGDALVMLDGWTESTGASAEAGVAKWVQLPRLTLQEAI